MSSENIYCLTKNEIIRENEVIQGILKDGLRLKTKSLKVNYLLNNKADDKHIKVGFLISKKKLKNHTEEITLKDYFGNLTV